MTTESNSIEQVVRERVARMEDALRGAIVASTDWPADTGLWYEQILVLRTYLRPGLGRIEAMSSIDPIDTPAAPAGAILLAKQRVILSTLVSVVHGVEESAEERGASTIETAASSFDPAGTEQMHAHRLDGAIFELSHAGEVRWTRARENDGARIAICVTERSLSGRAESLSTSAWSALDDEAIERTRRALGFKVLRHLIGRGHGTIETKRTERGEVAVVP